MNSTDKNFTLLCMFIHCSNILKHFCSGCYYNYKIKYQTLEPGEWPHPTLCWTSSAFGCLNQSSKRWHHSTDAKVTFTFFPRLTYSQLLQQPPELLLFLQEPQQVGGLHALKLHLPVDVDLVVEADVHETRTVPAVLAGVLTCTQDARSSESIQHNDHEKVLI